jgi:transglutaminase-like putative cysteine protease
LRRAALAWVLCACAASSPAPKATATSSAKQDVADGGEKPYVFLGPIDVKSSLGRQLAPTLARGEPLKMTLSMHDANASEWTELAKRAGVLAPAEATFTLVYAGYPASSDVVTDAYRKASFVVDFDEPAVQAVHDAVRASSPERPTMDALTRYVDQFIDKKDMQRTFDVASRVASHKEGDCSEHAVLLAALGRSFGYATRVVLGAVLVTTEGEVGAFGHAWVEYYGVDAKTWRVADAAMPAEVSPRYIPLTLLEDEGPAFTRHIVEDVGLLLLREIRIERP